MKRVAITTTGAVTLSEMPALQDPVTYELTGDLTGVGCTWSIPAKERNPVATKIYREHYTGILKVAYAHGTVYFSNVTDEQIKYFQ